MNIDEKMKVLVTGSEGFIGRAISKALIAKGMDLIGVDLKPSNQLSNNFIELNLNSLELDVLIKSQMPDVVIHAAAQSDVGESIKHPKLDSEMNIVATNSLLESFLSNGGKHFIYLQSGGAIYNYDSEFPIAEDGSVKPISPYGLSKLTSERYVELLCESAGVSWTSLALSNCYGPVDQNKKGVIYNFWDAISKDISPVINGTNVTRDFIHINDVVEAVLLVLNKPTNSRINISSSIEVSLGELYELICEVLKKDLNPILNSPIKGQITRSALSNKKAKEVLGWEQKIDLRKGIELMESE